MYDNDPEDLRDEAKTGATIAAICVAAGFIFGLLCGSLLAFVGTPSCLY